MTCNSDSFVRLHDGAALFHGTNPIACTVPAGDEPLWLFDMATSAIPYNRVKLAQSLGATLPGGAASDADGRDTQIPDEVRMLAPLGGVFGYKGAGLADMAEILSAVLTGMKLSFEAAPMAGPDFSTPRQLGAFVLAINPGAFLDQQDFRDRMKHYLASLRTSASRPGAAVLAPGDREWAEAERRRADGVPLDPATVEAFKALAGRFGLALPFDEEASA